MQADMTTVDAAVRIFIGILVALNIGFAALAWRSVPLFRKRGVRIAHAVLMVVFNVPAIAMIGTSHHLPAHMPEWLISAVVIPAFAWHMTHFFMILGVVFSSPIWVPFGLYRAARWLLKRRKQEPQPSDAPDSSRRAFLRNATVAVPGVLFGGMLTASYGSQSDPEIVTVDVPVPRLPPDLDGLRVVHVSDLHVGSFIRLSDVDRLVAQVNALAPDLFVFTGDLCDVPEVLDPTFEAFSTIEATVGRFAVLGNHEYFFDIREIRRRFEAAGIPALVDEHRRLDLGGNELIVTGVDYAWRRESFGLPLTTHDEHARAALAGAPYGGPPIIGLAHDPRAFEPLVGEGADLVLAGHFHGGQINLWDNEIDPDSPAQVDRRRVRGLYREGPYHLFLTAGAGHWMPLRINTPREIAVLTLRRV